MGPQCAGPFYKFKSLYINRILWEYNGTGRCPFTTHKEGLMPRTSYTARNILAKGRRLAVSYRLERKNPHMKGPCACGKIEGVVTVAVIIDKVKEGDKILSPHDLATRNAAGKVQNAMKSGKRMCEEHLAELMEVASRPDRMGQTFAS